MGDSQGRTEADDLVPPSKLRPSRSGLHTIERTALLDRAEVRNADVVWLVAPAGYGKTSFGLQWIAHSGQASVWINLDGTDDDPLVFIRTVVAALDHQLEAGIQMPGWLDGHEPEYTQRTRPWFLGQIARLGQLVNLVFDDIHEVASGATLDLIAATVENVPTGSHVMLISRQATGLPIGRWRGQGRLVELGATDLAFTLAETAEAAAAFGADVNSVGVSLLHDTTMGWPVMVYLVSTGSSPVSRRVATSEAVEEYVGEQVLRGLPPQLQEFLACCAVVEVVDARLAAELTGRADAGLLLADVAERTLLVGEVEGGYRYHPLLREYLRHRLERDQPATAAQLHARAARWYLTQGDADVAVHHAIAGDDPDVIAEVVWPSARIALLQGRPSSVARWLAQLPPDVRAGRVEMSLTEAWAGLASGDYGAAAVHTRSAVAAMPAGWHGRIAELPSAPWVAMLVAVAGQGGPVVAAGLAATALDALQPDDPSRPLARMIEGVNLALVGDARAVEALSEAAAMAEALEVSTTVVEARSLLSVVLVAQGRGPESERACESAQQRRRDAGLSGQQSTRAILLLGDVAQSGRRGSRRGLSDVTEELVQLRLTVGRVLPWFATLTAAVLAYAWARVGEVEQAQGYLRLISSGDPLAALVLPRWFADSARDEVARAIPLAQLTRAERRVWELLIGRQTMAEIADELCLSRETVKSHASSIYRKLDVASRRELHDLAAQWSSTEVLPGYRR